jgi:hypothetical protein
MLPLTPELNPPDEIVAQLVECCRPRASRALGQSFKRSVKYPRLAIVNQDCALLATGYSSVYDRSGADSPDATAGEASRYGGDLG